MDIALRVTDFEPNQHLNAYAERKVSRLQRYLSDIERTEIDLLVEPTRDVNRRRVARINVIMYGKVYFHVERRAADHFVAVDAAIDTLKEQLLRYKELRKDWRHNRRGQQAQQRAREETLQQMGAEPTEDELTSEEEDLMS